MSDLTHAVDSHAVNLAIFRAIRLTRYTGRPKTFSENVIADKTPAPAATARRWSLGRFRKSVA